MTQTISSGTGCDWVVPTGVIAIDLLVVGAGGGGGGGGAGDTSRYGGGGGGGGEVVQSLDVSVTPGSTLTVTVGSGGAGGAPGDIEAAAGYGDPGGTSTVTKGSAINVSASGGAGGTPGGDSPGTGGTSGSSNTGGVASGSQAGQGGSDASNGGASKSVNAGTSNSLSGSAVVYGNGGGGADLAPVNNNSPSYKGVTSLDPGSGGGGARGSINLSGGLYDYGYTGSAGNNGVVVLRYTPTSVATTTTTQVSSTEITYGQTIDDDATVSNDGGAADPTGTVTFSYCYNASSAPTTCNSGTGIGSAITLDGGTVGDGDSTASLTDWTPADGAGYYLLHAEYSGDSLNDVSADDGTNESFRVKKKTITVTPSGSTINAGATASYPFTYSDDFVSPDTADDLDTEPSCNSTYTGNAGSYTITCSGGSDNNYDFTYEEATLTVNSLTTSTVYTGQTFDSDGGGSSTLSAQVSNPACGGSVVFTVYNLDGNVVATQTGTVDTSTGLASVTVNLPYGIYSVTASFSGTGQCDASGDEAAISVINPNDPNTATVGGGYYKKTGFSPPRSNFGFTVQKVLSSSKTLIGYKGQLLWMNSKAWRLKASLKASDTSVFGGITCPTKDSSGRYLPSGSKCVAFRGSGYLQKWNSTFGGWETATQYGTNGLITFTVTVYDGGRVSVCKTSGKTKTCSSVDQEDWFGIQIDPVASTVLPETLPLSLQLPGNNGAIQIK